MTVLEGDLESTALHEVLESISAIDGSGILTVQGEDDIVAVSFLTGRIVAADALNQSVEEGLGKALRSVGLISAEDLAAAAKDHAGDSSGSFGELLVRRGLIHRNDLLKGLRHQTYDLMLQILGWRAGEFKFYGGDEVSYEDGFEPIPVDELLIRSIEDLGKQGVLEGPIPEIGGVYEQVPANVPVQVLGRDGDGSTGGIWLSSRQAAFLARIDGETEIDAIAAKAGLDEYQARLALYKLLRAGLVAFAGGAAQPPLAKPRQEQRVAAEPLRAEIFTPPEPASETSPSEISGAEVSDFAFEEMYGTPVSEPRGPLLDRWVGVALALFLVASMSLPLIARPGVGLLPFPWQDHQRDALERQLRQSLFLKIDRAAKVYFLVEAHYPDSLDDLVEIGLLSSLDRVGPAGHLLVYSTDDVGYRIDLQGSAAEDLGTNESITGDFLLDPQWLRVSADEEAPLVLLD